MLIGCDLFSGAGGMSLGAMMANINITVAVENNKHSAQTFAYNHPNTKVIAEDIKSISPEEHFKTNPFIVFGGPPCQGFSLSNTLTRTESNKNNSLFQEFLRFIKILEPEWFVFENVEGFQSFQKGKIITAIIDETRKIGYDAVPNVLIASDFGVPQVRKRFFIVGNKVNKKFVFPKSNRRKIFTVKDAISDLPKLKNGDNFEVLDYRTAPNSTFAAKMRGRSKKAKQNYVSQNEDYVIDRYKHIGPGQNWRAIPIELMQNYADRNNCHSGIYKRLDPDSPSVVISNYRKNMLIHPFQDRGLSLREAARLQSFPDSFIFKGTIMHMQQQIGNAVPPLLAKAIFKQILNTI